jgi:hypothetical protein
MAVSPFDGVNRIRFKGSPECGLSAADHGKGGSPETLFDSQTVEGILEPDGVNCKLEMEIFLAHLSERSVVPMRSRSTSVIIPLLYHPRMFRRSSKC